MGGLQAVWQQALVSCTDGRTVREDHIKVGWSLVLDLLISEYLCIAHMEMSSR